MDLNAALSSSNNVMSSTKSLMSKLSDDIPTMHRRNVSFQAPLFPLIPSQIREFFVIMAVSMMSSVLKKVNLGYLEGKFQQEKITPDLVCKLSVQELESLGLTSRRDMMALRIECAMFGGETPRKVQASCGAPSFSIPNCVLENILGEGFTIKEISTILSVSESTIYRRMSLFGLSKSDFTDISDLEVDHHIENITEDFPYCGGSLIKQFLIEKGIIVQRIRIRDSLHRVNGDGVNATKKRAPA